MVDTDILIRIWKNRVKKIDFVLKWLSRVGSEVGLTKVLCEGDTRNRWLDGQVCPDVGQGTKAPWARRLGCVLACYAQIGREKRRRREEREREETEGEDEKRWKRREEGGDGKGEGKRVGERQRGARLVWRKGLSPGWEWKDDERRWH
ncbi:hypothetical protein TNCV_469071 [Trichonephila clavipes]|nr:hypothetical protein TNCV_469071 [Trichonephila clavipes]